MPAGRHHKGTAARDESGGAPPGRWRSRMTGTLIEMRWPYLFRSLLVLSVMVPVACGHEPTASTAGSTVVPTAPKADLPTEPAPVSIPSGFALEVPTPLTAGNAWMYAQRALFERTGSLCFTSMEAEPGGDPGYEAMAADLGGSSGLLANGRSFVGRLDDALVAFDLQPTGIATGRVAYGIGQVTPERAMPQLPAGTVWTPRLDRFDLSDGRTGWTLSATWIAVVDRSCSVLPTTPD